MFARKTYLTLTLFSSSQLFLMILIVHTWRKVQVGGVFKLSNDGRRSEHIFINRDAPFAVNAKRAFFRISALSRYLTLNLNASRLAYTYPFCMVANFPCDNIKTFKANIADSSESSDPQRYENSRKASDIFLMKISKFRETPAKRKRTVFVIDADRNHIYDPRKSQKSEYFSKQRKYFIEKAEDYGFTVIDMEPIFSKHYQENRQRFEFSNDAHWNSLGHEIVSKQIAKELDLTLRSK